MFQPKRRRVGPVDDHSESESSSSDDGNEMPPPLTSYRPPYVLRKGRKGGNVSWGTAPPDQEIDSPSESESEYVPPRSRSAGPKRGGGSGGRRCSAPPDGSESEARMVALEASVSAFADQNDKLYEQNQMLLDQMAGLQRRLADGPGSSSGNVITKVTPFTANISAKTIEKIKEGKFVEFRKLLDSPEDEDSTSRTLSTDGRGNSLVFKSKQVKNKKKRLSFTEWSLAWSRFRGVLESVPGGDNLPARLSQHFETIHGLLKSGADWQTYDRKFRKLVETDEDVVFGSVHFDLYQAASKSEVSTDSGRKCYKFNSPRGCALFHCKFNHSCLTCGLPHPVFRCPRRFSLDRRGASSQLGRSVTSSAVSQKASMGFGREQASSSFPQLPSSSQQVSSSRQFAAPQPPRPFLPRNGQNFNPRPFRPQGPRF